MKIRKLLLPLALLACCSPAWAQSHLKAILKDGSELTGYISRQRPGEDFTFSTSRATIFMPASKAKSMLENEVKYNSLSLKNGKNGLTKTMPSSGRAMPEPSLSLTFSLTMAPSAVSECWRRGPK